MKKINFIVLLFVVNFSSTFAQITQQPHNGPIIPLHSFLEYKHNKISIPKNAYFKDVESDLEKFTGSWKTESEGKIYEIIISKNTKSFDDRFFDELILKYKISYTTGTEIINTLNMNLSNSLVVRGYFLYPDKSSYCFNYVGNNSECGINMGWFYVSNPNNDSDKLLFKYKSWSNKTFDCTDTNPQEIFPKTLVLNKQ